MLIEETNGYDAKITALKTETLDDFIDSLFLKENASYLVDIKKLIKDYEEDLIIIQTDQYGNKKIKPLKKEKKEKHYITLQGNPYSVERQLEHEMNERKNAKIIHTGNHFNLLENQDKLFVIIEYEKTPERK